MNSFFLIPIQTQFMIVGWVPIPGAIPSSESYSGFTSHGVTMRDNKSRSRTIRNDAGTIKNTIKPSKER
jgi:hypothetical protein